MKFLWAIFLVLTVSTYARADFVTCKNVKLSLVSVQGNRDDGHIFANKLVLKLKDASGNPYACAGRDYIHLDNSDAIRYDALLSMAITGYTAQLNLNISVNTNSQTFLSNQLSIISLAD